MSPKVTCYDINVSRPLRCTSVGIREPHEPFGQPQRVRDDFVAFLVVRGEIHLTDYLPEPDPVVVRPGEIHIIGPGYHQASTRPFPPGIKFLWFHFEFPVPYRSCDAAQAQAAIKELYKPSDTVTPQPRWLIPRRLSLASELDTFTRLHAELLDNVRLWNLEDAGTQSICAHMVYMLHRGFVAEAMRSAGAGTLDAGRRFSPEASHVGRARQFIRLNYERDISLAEVAEDVGLNPAYLSRCFKRVTGETVVDFIWKTRIEAAKTHLSEGSGSIKEVAFMSGFSSAAYFCRIFRHLERQTPMQYAQKTRKR